MFDIIAFDADDTLWKNEDNYLDVCINCSTSSHDSPDRQMSKPFLTKPNTAMYRTTVTASRATSSPVWRLLSSPQTAG